MTETHMRPVILHLYTRWPDPNLALLVMLEILPLLEYLPAMCPGPDASRQIRLFIYKIYELSDSLASSCEITLPLYFVILCPGNISFVAKRPNPAPSMVEGLISHLSKSPDRLSQFSIIGSSGVVDVDVVERVSIAKSRSELLGVFGVACATVGDTPLGSE